MMKKYVLLSVLFLSVVFHLNALPSREMPWSQRLAESVIRHNPSVYGKKWDYVNGTVLSGMQGLYTETGKKEYLDYVRSTIQAHRISYNSGVRTLDNIKEGTAVLFLYENTDDPIEKESFKKFAAEIYTLLGTGPGSIGRTSEGGLYHKDPTYEHQMWADGLYMAQPFYAHYLHLFDPENTAAFDDIANQFLLFEKYARDPKTGLLYHGWSEQPLHELSTSWANPETGLSQNFWARAVGWYVMGLVDTLDYFPVQHSKHVELVAILERLIPSIITFQDDTGVWYDVMDQGPRKGIVRSNYLEASASCMFAYSILKSVRLGYVDSMYKIAGIKAYEGILSQFMRIQGPAKGELLYLIQQCAVSGLGGKSGRDGSFEYYMREPVVTSIEDGKPIGPFILASLEIEGM